MANVSSMKEFARVAKEWTEGEANKDLIPVFLEEDCGVGAWSTPTKKRNTFKMGEIQAVKGLFTPDKQDDLRTVHNIGVRVLAFIPREIASDEVIKISKEKDEKEATDSRTAERWNRS